MWSGREAGRWKFQFRWLFRIQYLTFGNHLFILNAIFGFGSTKTIPWKCFSLRKIFIGFAAVLEACTTLGRIPTIQYSIFALKTTKRGTVCPDVLHNTFSHSYLSDETSFWPFLNHKETTNQVKPQIHPRCKFTYCGLFNNSFSFIVLLNKLKYFSNALCLSLLNMTLHRVTFIQSKVRLSLQESLPPSLICLVFNKLSQLQLSPPYS